MTGLLNNIDKHPFASIIAIVFVIGWICMAYGWMTTPATNDDEYYDPK